MTRDRTRRFLAVLTSFEGEQARLRVPSSNEAEPTIFPWEERPSGLGSLARLIEDIETSTYSRAVFKYRSERRSRA